LQNVLSAPYPTSAPIGRTINGALSLADERPALTRQHHDYAFFGKPSSGLSTVLMIMVGLLASTPWARSIGASAPRSS
jgi:hypothetical protein